MCYTKQMPSEYYKTGYSEEEREKRRQKAMEMHQEIVVDEQTGLERRKFGGPQPRSGRPRKIRASEVIAQKVVKEADAYFDRLDKIAKEGRDGNSLMAIKELLDIEERERKITVEEEENLDRLHRDELIILALDLLKDTGVIGSGSSRVGEIEIVRDGEFTELNT